MQTGYSIPDEVRIGHIHLKVSDLDTSLAFYEGILGFQVTQRYGSQVVFLSAGNYHHHIALNTWMSKGGAPAAKNSAGLFHLAILYPQRKDLAAILARLVENNYPLDGSSDHGVSEAIYLRDPDENGVELYWDKPETQWPRNSDGSLNMFTHPLNIQDLLKLNNS